MVAPLFFIVTAALWWHPASGLLAQSTATITDFVCRNDARHYSVTADYRIWRSARVRVARSDFTAQCVVNVNMTTSSERQQPQRPPQLLLVTIEQLRLKEPLDTFTATLADPIRRTDDFCSNATHCGSTYLWASESVSLHLYVKSGTGSNISYDAVFVVTEATNICGLANFTGELLVQSGGNSEYAFASDSRHKHLPPNSVTCNRDSEYSLTVRSSITSSLLTVTVLACPWFDSCGTLKLNDQSCTDDVRVMSAPPGSSVTLRYVLGSCNGGHKKYAGFVVSARAVPFAKTPSTLIAVVASVAGALGAALVVVITIALLRHRRRQRSSGRKPPSSSVHYARSTASAGDEEIAMVGNDLYGVTLASRTTADQ